MTFKASRHRPTLDHPGVVLQTRPAQNFHGSARRDDACGAIALLRRATRIFAAFIPASLSLSLISERWNELVELAIHITESAEAAIQCQGEPQPTSAFAADKKYYKLRDIGES